MNETVNDIVGCNVRGRLQHIEHLLRFGRLVDAHEEVEKLLIFFEDGQGE